MSQTDSVPVWTVPRKFEASLKCLLTAAHRGGVAFDRSWTFRRTNDGPDLMVEVTRLGRNSETPTQRDRPASELDAETFETELSALLYDDRRCSLPFDRSWTFRCDDGSHLMVEITRLAKAE